ncbi:MAG: hypothetical protein ACRDK5_03415 [Solirubrobacterales bacterium]
MALTREIAAFDFVELTEPVDAAPAGARGGVLEIAPDGTAMVEVIEPELEGLERIVFCPVAALRAVSGRMSA